jgi:hypothetical protein
MPLFSIPITYRVRSRKSWQAPRGAGWNLRELKMKSPRNRLRCRGFFQGDYRCLKTKEMPVATTVTVLPEIVPLSVLPSLNVSVTAVPLIR